jgi:VanZ family protein
VSAPASESEVVDVGSDVVGSVVAVIIVVVGGF